MNDYNKDLVNVSMTLPLWQATTEEGIVKSRATHWDTAYLNRRLVGSLKIGNVLP